MAYTVKVFLDTRRQKDDGSYPIKLRFRAYNRPGEIPTDYSVLTKHWDADKKAIKTTCKDIPNLRRVNIRIQEKKTHAMNVLSDLEDAGELPLMTAKEMKAAIEQTKDRRGGNRKKVSGTMVLAFFNERIEEMRQAKKTGNANVYKLVRNSMALFLKKQDVPLERVNYKWLRKYEAWYLARTNKKGKPNTWNGLSVNLRTLRALFNEAIKRKLVPADAYPFKEYSIKNEKTRKRAISEADITKLIAVVPETSRQERAKDYFLMSFYLMGASFVDVAFLKMSDIVDERIEYKRRKTGRLHSIKITAALQTLLDKYTVGKKPESYILDVIKGDTEEKRYASVRDELRRYNRSLKELAEMAGITAPLTSYTARHSFATIAKFKGASTAIISEALGHESEEVTQVYLDSFDKSVLDSFNEMVLGE